MRRRLILLFVLCALLQAMRALPGGVPAVAGARHLIWVDMASMSLTLYEHGEKVASWPVAVGKSETPTPLGVFRIAGRFTTEPSGFGTRFLRLDVPWGIYGIHGTNCPGSIGTRASHGCIRMFTRDAERLYKLVPNGTTVVIEDGPYGGFGWRLRKLVPGNKDTQVREAQKRLWVLGYYRGGFDGIYGPGTTDAVKRFKADHGLPAEDCIDAGTWDAMGVILFE